MAVNVVLKSVWDDKGVKGAESAFDNIGKTIGKLGGLIAGAFSVNALLEFTKAAAEDAKSAALLAEQLRNTVGANEDRIIELIMKFNHGKFGQGSRNNWIFKVRLVVVLVKH